MPFLLLFKHPLILKGQSTDFTHEYEFICHEKYYSVVQCLLYPLQDTVENKAVGIISVLSCDFMSEMQPVLQTEGMEFKRLK